MALAKPSGRFRRDRPKTGRQGSFQRLRRAGTATRATSKPRERREGAVYPAAHLHHVYCSKLHQLLSYPTHAQAPPPSRPDASGVGARLQESQYGDTAQAGHALGTAWSEWKLDAALSAIYAALSARLAGRAYILMQAMMCCPYMSQASGEGLHPQMKERASTGRPLIPREWRVNR